MIQIDYDPAKTSYRVMVEYAWRNIDPTDGGGQFCDRGGSYRPAIFYSTEEGREIAEETRDEVLEQNSWTADDVAGVALLRRPIFWEAEDYHQDYYLKKPGNYGYYKNACGRTKRLKAVWGEDVYECYHDIDSTCFTTVLNAEGMAVEAEVNIKGGDSERVGLLPDNAIIILSVAGGVLICGIALYVSRRRARRSHK